MTDSKPQKLIVYNKHLPYDVSKEAERNLAEIKYNLGRAVVFQEVTPGISLWCNRLVVYLRLHGRNFSKEDHVILIKLFYRLITMPGMEPQFVKGFSLLLYKLLKKRKLLTRDDLQLPWRPLYELVKSIRYSKLVPVGLEQFPGKYLETVTQVAKLARSYFTLESTEEMLLEFRPLLCPLDAYKINASFYLSLFLPTQIPEGDKSYGLWLEELLNYWFNSTQNNYPIADQFSLLFARLAERNVGKIDWTPYISQIFNIFLKNLNLPVNGTKGRYTSKGNMNSNNIFAKWFVYMMGGENGHVLMDHLERLFIALKSFFHPSNYGAHSFVLLGFLKGLVNTFIRRLNNERFQKPSWITTIPEPMKISDTDIEKFILVVKDVALLSVFNKSGSITAASVLQSLSLLRADLVLPSLIDRTFEALETLVEPHQVTATLNCITAVAKALVTGCDRMPSAPTKILPLLHLVLPGIDTNDLRKSLCVFTFISAIVKLIPLVDCTPALDAGIEMTEIERELCLASGQFEDVVLQLMDRCFVLVENSTSESITEQDSILGNAVNIQENILLMNNTSTIQSVLMQCSLKIFKSALDSLFTFVSTRVLEVKVAGRMVSDMCRSAAKSRPEITLKKFLPYITSCVINLASVDGVSEEEHVDPELLWYMEMLSEVVRCNGVCLIPYKEILKQVLDLTLHLKCKKANARSAKLLKSLLSSLTEVYILEWRSCADSFDEDPAQHFYIRDWGKTLDVDMLDIQWHTTSEVEMEFVNDLLNRYMRPEMETIKAFMTGQEVMTRDELQQRLEIIHVCVYGAATLLPMWEDKVVESIITPSSVARGRTLNILMPTQMQSYEICIQRKEVAYLMHEFFEFMLKEHEDDAKSFRVISKIYETLVLHNGVHWDEFNIRWNTAMATKRALEDKLHGNKSHVRAVHLDRVQLQHDMRVLQQYSAPFTYTEKMILNDLTIMGTSDYTEVRMDSQRVLFGCLEVFDFSTRSLLPGLLENLKPDSKVSHEKLKGTLYILQYSRFIYLISHYFEAMVASWKLILQANKSEKPSIVSLMNKLIKRVQMKYDTLRVYRKIDQDCIDIATELLNTKSPEPYSLLDSAKDDSIYPSQGLIEKAERDLAEKNEVNFRNFRSLEDELCSLLQDTSIHWRCSEMCVGLLNLLINDEIKASALTIQTYAKLIVCDSLALRKAATKGIIGVLHQNKPEFKKMNLDFTKFGIEPRKEILFSLKPGDNRPDNEWLQYRDSTCINSQKDLDEFIFVDKTFWGYQTWPQKLQVYSHDKDFYSVTRNRGNLSAGEVTLLDSLCDSQFVEKFFNFFSMEVKKGEDKFRHSHFILFKSIFRNYGAVILQNWKASITNLLTESVESKHRFATEIISGLIRGSKNWNFEDLNGLWDFLIPLLKHVFSSNVMVETCHDWNIAMINATESLDPNRFHRLFQMITDNPLNGTGGSQGDSNRLLIVQKTLGQQEWRVESILQSFFKYTMPHLGHPFKIVRDSIGSLLSFMLMCDLKYGSYTPTKSPTVELLIDYVIEDLTLLSQSVMEQQDSNPEQRDKAILMEVDEPGNVNNVIDEKESSSEDEERKRRERVAKTVLTFLLNNAYTLQSVNKQIYRLIPVLMPLESREDDPDMAGLCKATFSLLSTKRLPEDMIFHAFDTIMQVCNFKSWNARKCGLNFLKSMVFYNIFSMDHEEIKEKLRNLLFERLKDEQVEVREIASTIWSGLVHYGYFQITDELLQTFYKMAKTRVKKKRQGIELSPTDTEKNTKASQLKHGGVLGLSALVLAFPYDVKIWMPEVVIYLGEHLHDLPQVTATVKKTLSEFRRTHHDNWHLHRQMFTDDQLTALTDLLVSPSYYA